MLDKIKLLVAVLLIAAGITGFYTYADEALLYRVLALLAVFIVAFIITLKTEVGFNAWNFGRSAVLEVRKAVWPTRQETVQTTLIIMVAVAFMSLLLWGIDALLVKIVALALGQEI